MGASREEQLTENLKTVRSRIDAACAESGRDPGEVTVVAITKTRLVADVRLLADLGISHIGENRDQEARGKADACADLDLTWHFVGQLQRNKAGSVVTYADVVESVDRLALVSALDRAAGRAGRRVGACVQIDLDPTDPGARPPGSPRGGAQPRDVLALADQIADSSSLDLLGVMAVAPLGQDPREAFDRLATMHDALRAQHSGASMRSAGMSGDFEPAIAAGATHVRLGSALLGHREPLK